MKRLLIVFLLVLQVVLSFSRNSVWKDGFTLWSDVVQKAPENWRALYNLSLEYHAKKDLDTALKYLMKIVDSGGYKWHVLSKIGSILADKGLYEEALIWHMRSLSVAEGIQKARAYNYLGVTYHKKGDLTNAERALKESIAIDPSYSDAHYNLGVVYWNKKEIDKAIDCFKNTIKLLPSYFDAYYNLGVIYGNKGDIDNAIDYFTKALYIKETDEVYLKRSLAYRLKNDMKKALEDLEKARRLNPSLKEDLLP